VRAGAFQNVTGAPTQMQAPEFRTDDFCQLILATKIIWRTPILIEAAALLQSTENVKPEISASAP